MTIDEAIEIFKLDKHETLLNVSGLYNINIISWLEELKVHRMALENCKRNNFRVNSIDYAKTVEEWIAERMKELEECE